MDVIEAIVGRRSCRDYSDKPVEFDKITACLEAGHYAPSAGNLQAWKFIIVTDKGTRSAIADHCMEQYWMAKAPVHIVVVANEERVELKYGLRGKRLYAVQGCAAAMENIMLTAHALGLGSCWVGAFEEEFLNSTLGIPDFARAQAIITLGYPGYEKPVQKDLTSLQSIVYFEAYGNRLSTPHLVLRDFSVEWERQFENAKEKASPYIKESVNKIKEGLLKMKSQIEEQKNKKKTKPEETENESTKEEPYNIGSDTENI